MNGCLKCFIAVIPRADIRPMCRYLARLIPGFTRGRCKVASQRCFLSTFSVLYALMRSWNCLLDAAGMLSARKVRTSFRARSRGSDFTRRMLSLFMCITVFIRKHPMLQNSSCFRINMMRMYDKWPTDYVALTVRYVRMITHNSGDRV